MGLGRTAVTAIALASLATPASATQVRLYNGVTGVGYLDIDVDDFGFYGRQQSMMTDDNYWVPGESRQESTTFMAGVYLLVTTPGDVSSAVVLTQHNKFWAFAEPGPQTDGIVGGHANLTRTVTTPNSGGPTLATSAFRIADAGAMLQLDVALRQELAPRPVPEALLVQTYAITNNGGVPADLVWFAFWDADLYFHADSSWTNDIVGAGPGLCYVYLHQPGKPQEGVALRDGGGTAPRAYYVAAKAGDRPDPAGPEYNANINGDPQPVFDSWSKPVKGMPVTWRDHVARVGYQTPGADTTGFDGDAWIALEYRVSLAVGETRTIVLERYYGTNVLPCGGGAQCGNGAVDGDEGCDSAGVDTADCNGATCTAPACGDGVLNLAAGEECESLGIDSEACNGATCTAARCGDGYLNPAAGEECEDGALCDLATCSYAFSLGGGCAGCAAPGDAAGRAWLVMVLGWWWSRRTRLGRGGGRARLRAHDRGRRSGCRSAVLEMR